MAKITLLNKSLPPQEASVLLVGSNKKQELCKSGTLFFLLAPGNAIGNLCNFSRLALVFQSVVHHKLRRKRSDLCFPDLPLQLLLSKALFLFVSEPPGSNFVERRERRLAKFRQNVARFRLYRLRFLQENMRFAAFFKIYQILKLNFLKFDKILQILRHLQFFC